MSWPNFIILAEVQSITNVKEFWAMLRIKRIQLDSMRRLLLVCDISAASSKYANSSLLLIFLEAQLCDLLRTRGHHHLHSENYPSESKVWGIKLKVFQSPQNVNNGQARDAKGHKGHLVRKRSIRGFFRNVNCFSTYGSVHLQYKYQNGTFENTQNFHGGIFKSIE